MSQDIKQTVIDVIQDGQLDTGEAKEVLQLIGLKYDIDLSAEAKKAKLSAKKRFVAWAADWQSWAVPGAAFFTLGYLIG